MHSSGAWLTRALARRAPQGAFAVFVSVLIFQNPVTAGSVGGYGVTLAGCALYTELKRRDRLEVWMRTHAFVRARGLAGACARAHTRADMHTRARAGRQRTAHHREQGGAPIAVARGAGAGGVRAVNDSKRIPQT